MKQASIFDTFHAKPLTLDQARALYAERLIIDFPEDELKPFSMLEAAWRRGAYACFGAISGGAILAYAFFVKLPGEDGALLDYFAVDEALRGRGIGGDFLRALVAGPLKGLEGALLEVEDPDAAKDDAARSQQNRRLLFYLRNGMTDTAVTARVQGVDFRLLAMPVGKRLPREGVRRLYERLYHAVLPPCVYEEWVVIP